MVQLEERRDIFSTEKKKFRNGVQISLRLFSKVKGICDYSGNTVRTKVSNLKHPAGYFKPSQLRLMLGKLVDIFFPVSVQNI